MKRVYKKKTRTYKTQMGYHHQDWTTVVLNQKNQQKQSQHVKAPAATVSTTTNKPAWKIEQQVDSDKGKPIQFISKQDSDMLKNLRIALKLTQSELATRLNSKVKDIQDIEACKAVENKAVIASMKRKMQAMLDAAKTQ